MKNLSDAMKRLQRIIPAGISPKFSSAKELMEWQQEEGRKHSEQLNRENQRTRIEKNSVVLAFVIDIRTVLLKTILLRMKVRKRHSQWLNPG